MATVLLVANTVWPQNHVASITAERAASYVQPISGRLHAVIVPKFAKVEAAAAVTKSRSLGNTSPSATSIPEQINVLRANRPAVDCMHRSCIALSFDDGPNSATTPAILDVLEQRHVAASFFLVGSHISGNEGIVRRMAASGYEIGNHTWDHRDMTKLTPEQVRQELLQTQTAIAATGAPLPTLYRPPYGSVDPNIVKEAGLQMALWNEDPRDWQATDPVLLAQTIVDNARSGGVVDLHDIHQVTVDALPTVLDQLQAKGFTFVTVSDLMRSRPRTAGEPFYGFAAPTPQQ
jgi:peptidoglycan/xylan/chitin deacetylase (PgdA/CDA1 family)